MSQIRGLRNSEGELDSLALLGRVSTTRGVALAVVPIYGLASKSVKVA